MMNKKDKVIIAGFIAMSVLGMSGTFYLLTRTPSNPQKTEQVDTSLEIVDPIAEVENHVTKDNQNDEVVFEDEHNQELPEKEADTYLEQVRDLINKQQFKEVLSLLEPVALQYNLTTEKNKVLASHYADANLMVVQESVDEPAEKGRIIRGVKDPETLAIGIASSDFDTILSSVFNGNSVAAGGSKNVRVDGPIEFLPAQLEGEDVVNTQLLENPQIKLFLDRSVDIYELNGVYAIPMVIHEVGMTAYVAKENDGELSLIGYYVNEPEEFGNRFKAVDWHLEQEQKLGDAIKNDWE